MKFTKSTRLQDIKRYWHLVDVKDAVLGRVSTKIAILLMGKSKPYYIPHLDCGDYVVVTNATKVRVTGKKSGNKTYDRYSGYPGGLKKKTYNQIMITNPERIMTESVSGMLPKNKLHDLMMKRLYVFKDDNHPYKDKIK